MIFPKKINDKIIFDGGNQDIEFHEYFQIHVFCYDLTGHSALKVIYKNNLQDAHENQCIFSILTEPASLNHFAFALNK